MKKVKADNNSKYKPGEFGYIWVVEEGKEDIEGTDYIKEILITVKME